MNREREKILIDRAQAGSDAATNELLAENDRSIQILTTKFSLRGSYFEAEDLRIEGMLALSNCIMNFNASRGCRLWTMASPRVWGAMVDALRSASNPRLKNQRQYEIRFSELDAPSDSYIRPPVSEHARGAEHPEFRAIENREAILHLIGPGVPVAVAYYLGQKSMKEVAAEMGFSESRVSTALRDELKFIRLRIANRTNA